MHIITKTITIRKASKQDIAILYGWWNDGDIMAHAGFPNGLGLAPNQVQQAIEENPGLHMIEYQGQVIGEIHYTERYKGTADIGIKICHPNYRNQGLGKIILSLFIKQLFLDQFQSISLETNPNNLPAQKVYQALGFKKGKLAENSWIDQLGQLQSSLTYQLVEEDFVDYSNSL